MAAFCLATVGFLIVRDLWLPAARGTEVWFGFELTGAAARWSAPLHWALYAGAAWGFWRVRPWVWPWASLYAFGIAASHLVWNLTSANGGGLRAGLVQAGLFALPAAALWWARPPAAQAGRNL